MQQIGELLTTDTGTNRLLNTMSTDTNSTDSGYWTDYYVDTKVADLTNKDFRAWYCKVFYQLGKPRVDAIASIARKGKHPQRYFSVLLKQALQQGS